MPHSDRTERATPRRLREARDEGRVPRSRELMAAGVLLIVTTVVWAGAPAGFGALAGLVRDGLSQRSAPTSGSLAPAGREAALRGAAVAVPLLGGAMLAAYLAGLGQIGWLFAPARVQPRLSNLHPVRGARRLLDLRTLERAILDTLRVPVAATVAGVILYDRREQIASLPHLEAIPAWVLVGRTGLVAAFGATATLFVFGAADYGFQRWKHARELRMTRRELRDERRQTDGDPEVRRAQRRRRQAWLAESASEAVPRAAIVVRDGARIAAALAYDPRSESAPRLVAVGSGRGSAGILDLATRHGVPILERPLLTRALQRLAVGSAVPPTLYPAIAEAMTSARPGGGRRS